MNIKLFYAFFVLLFVASCANQSPPKSQPTSPLVISYSQFGPPQLVTELLGKYQYSWPDADNHKPVQYNIQVVIYNEGDLENAQANYMTDKTQKLEYRFVEYSKVTSWLDEKIEYFATDIQQGDSENVAMMFPFLQQLYKTSLIIEKHF